MPGNTADAKAWRDSGLAGICQGVTVLGDGAYINTGLVVPHRNAPAAHSCRARNPTTRNTDVFGLAGNTPSPA